MLRPYIPVRVTDAICMPNLGEGDRLSGEKTGVCPACVGAIACPGKNGCVGIPVGAKHLHQNTGTVSEISVQMLRPYTLRVQGLT